MRPLRAGTRGSALARWQTDHASAMLRAAWPGLEVEPVVVTTRGDVDLSDRLTGRLDKGFFTEELEHGLRAGELDIAVHSLKDLPTADAPGLTVGAVLPRGPGEDWLVVRPEAVSEQGRGQLPLAPGARVGSSAVRREALLRVYAPQATALPLRGNVPTRLERLREGRYEAIVIAAAGLSRLGLDLSGLSVYVLAPRRWIPAPGQGAVAVQCRAEDAETRALLAAIHHAPTAHAVHWERALLAASQGGCASAFGARLLEDHLIWGLEQEGWRRYKAPAPSGGPEGRAGELFHNPGPPWEDDDDEATCSPL